MPNTMLQQLSPSLWALPGARNTALAENVTSQTLKFVLTFSGTHWRRRLILLLPLLLALLRRLPRRLPARPRAALARGPLMLEALRAAAPHEPRPDARTIWIHHPAPSGSS